MQPKETNIEIARSGTLTVYQAFASRVDSAPEAIAIEQGGLRRSYGALNDRVLPLAAALLGRGIGRGDRIAIVSENRHEYLEWELAAACIGAILACQNWRLAPAELDYCIKLVAPSLLVVSERYRAATEIMDFGEVPRLVIDADHEALIAGHAPLDILPFVDAEDGLLILYTSGSTGFPKGALVSHRAEIARMAVMRMDMRVTESDGYVAWAPLFHMGGSDPSLSSLMSGATVHVVDGYIPAEIVEIMTRADLGWMLLMPGTIEPVVELLRTGKYRVQSIRAVGALADLVPQALISELSRLTNAPYLNSFGATETGLAPASAVLIPPGTIPTSLSKRKSSLCDLKLVDENFQTVADGDPGEAAVRGPTVFSGYWNAGETNARDFRDGWFRMGDLFRRNADGSYDFVDRSKYMIKSGGENIYPAEIERVLLADARIEDAIVIRKQDARWGEVPVAFVARKDGDLTEADVEALCRQSLAGYKRPREVHFVAFADFPRNTTGKIVRGDMESKYRALLA
ncbi:class I adenylate-forming enzyme family protein [Rhizobium sp.]